MPDLPEQRGHVLREDKEEKEAGMLWQCMEAYVPDLLPTRSPYWFRVFREGAQTPRHHINQDQRLFHGYMAPSSLNHFFVVFPPAGVVFLWRRVLLGVTRMDDPFGNLRLQRNPVHLTHRQTAPVLL
ncbi:hypothetical protein C8R44DRAFT_737976 [Mycena epipterygia]|nr:hypothetical protein C8R44DRAFT_737976 [Mycena epipterygia]